MNLFLRAEPWLNMSLRRSTNYLLNNFEIALKRKRLLSRPIELCIEPTNRCNSECVLCTNPAERRKGATTFGDMTWETFLRTRPFWDSALRIELSGNGEPFLHPRYLEMARELKKEGCFAHCFSNGLLLDEGVSKELVTMGYDLIGLSMGGATDETYRFIRGVDGLRQVVKNLRKLKEIKKAEGVKKPEIHFNIAAMNSVLAELDDLVRLAAELEVTSIDMFHLLVFFDHVRPESPWMNLDVAREQMERAGKTAREYGVNLTLPGFEPRDTFCRHPFNHFLVRWDGVVVSCVGHRFLLGDLNTQSPGTVWNSAVWQNLRRRILKQGYKNVCPDCNTWQANRRDLLLHASPNLGEKTIDLGTQNSHA